MEVASLSSSLNAVFVDDVKVMCKYFLQAVVAGSSSANGEAVDARLDAALLALTTFLCEAGKAAAKPEAVRESLAEQGVAAEAAAVVAELYVKHRDKIVAHMAATGIAAPAIVGVDWRLDYSVRSNTCGRSNEPLFFVTLTVKDRGLLRRIDLMATAEQLDDWLAKVKDAVKETDRLLNNGNFSASG